MQCNGVKRSVEPPAVQVEQEMLARMEVAVQGSRLLTWQVG